MDFTSISLNHMLWIYSMRYSKMLEESAFHGRRADFIWLLTVSATLILV